MSFGVIFIPTNGDFYLKKFKIDEIFNEIGKFVLNDNTTKLDTKMCYQTSEYSYELIVSPDPEKNILNYYASKLLNIEVYGNAVLIAETTELASIESINIISNILNNRNKCKCVVTNTNGLMTEHIYPISSIIPNVINHLDSDKSIKKTFINKYKLYGYELELYWIDTEDILKNNYISLLLQKEDTIEFKSNSDENIPTIEEINAENDDETANDDNENTADDKTAETQTQDDIPPELSCIKGTVIVLNKFNGSYVDLSINELKKLLLISTYNIRSLDSKLYDSYINSFEVPDEENPYIVKNRYNYINNVYKKITSHLVAAE